MEDQDKNLINDVDMKDGEFIKQEALAVESIFSFFFVSYRLGFDSKVKQRLSYSYSYAYDWYLATEPSSFSFSIKCHIGVIFILMVVFKCKFSYFFKLCKEYYSFHLSFTFY